MKCQLILFGQLFLEYFKLGIRLHGKNKNSSTYLHNIL